MAKVDAGVWTIEVSDFEPSTFNVELHADGSVTGGRHIDEIVATVTGSWNFTDPVLELDLSSQAGLHPQPVSYTIRLSDDTYGSDDEGHRFTLHKH